MYEELWCDVCGAKFREQCTCPDQPPEPTLEERWVGIDGHAYVGDKKHSAGAYHDTENCRCPQGANFDPEEWY